MFSDKDNHDHHGHDHHGHGHDHHGHDHHGNEQNIELNHLPSGYRFPNGSILIKHGNHTHLQDNESIEDFQVFFLTMIIISIVFQITILVWKKSHPQSFHFFSLGGLWVVPFLYALYSKLWFLLTIWTSFTMTFVYVLSIARQKPVKPTTPKFVYRFFLVAYRLSLASFFFGAIISLVIFFIITPVPHFISIFLYLLFGGLYFGVLSRDIAEVCAETLATNIGYYNKKGLPERQLLNNICALCAQNLSDDQQYSHENFQLACGHEFHNHCLRGWTMLGKKNICPYCSAKVSITASQSNFWNTHSQNWGQLLDFVRHFIVWNPILALIVYLIVSFFHSHHKHSRVFG